MVEPEAEATEFWEFSLVAYARPGVADACLSLQDRHGCEVNLLFLCLWLASLRCWALRQEDLRGAQQSAAAPTEHLVRPVRVVRRWFKQWSRNSLDHELHASVYAALKHAELQGERLIQARLLAGLNLDLLETAHSPEAAARISFDNYRVMLSTSRSAARELEELMTLVLS